MGIRSQISNRIEENKPIRVSCRLFWNNHIAYIQLRPPYKLISNGRSLL